MPSAATVRRLRLGQDRGDKEKPPGMPRVRQFRAAGLAPNRRCFLGPSSIRNGKEQTAAEESSSSEEDGGSHGLLEADAQTSLEAMARNSARIENGDSRDRQATAPTLDEDVLGKQGVSVGSSTVACHGIRGDGLELPRTSTVPLVEFFGRETS